MSSSGGTCQDYIDNNWCTSDGGYGAAWGANWGTFGDYKNVITGHDAFTCTVCGCKEEPTTTAGAVQPQAITTATPTKMVKTDTDDCASNSQSCDSNATCRQKNLTAESSLCVCSKGFSGDGLTCQDIDECIVENNNSQTGTNTSTTESTGSACGPNGTCVNTVGSYECTCAVGYTDSGSVGCKDVNECSQNNLCDDVADCTNTIGSYDCICWDGYIGNGVSCTSSDGDSITSDSTTAKSMELINMYTLSLLFSIKRLF